MTSSLFSTQQSSGASTSTDTSSQSSVAAAAGTADPLSTMFTQLLVAQIQNQDPTAPTDPSTYVNQLALLSQTQSMQTLASQGTSTGSVLQSLQWLSLGAEVGSNVMVNSSTVTLGSSVVNGAFTLQNASATTALELTGVDGQKHRIELGTHGPGELSFSIDPAKLGLSAGTYSMAVVTDNKETPAIEVAGTISSVRISSTGSPLISVTGVGDVPSTALTRFIGKPA